MRKRTIDRLLREAIIEEAEEQGALLEREPAEPVPADAQARFDAALNGTRKKSKRTIDDMPSEQPQPKKRAHRWLAYGLTAVSAAAVVLVVVLLIGIGGIRGTKAPEPFDMQPPQAETTLGPVPQEPTAPEPVAPTEPEPGELTGQDALVGTWKLKAMESEDESQSAQIAMVNALIAAGQYNAVYIFGTDGTGTALWDINGEKSTQQFVYTIDGDTMTFSGETMTFAIEGDRLALTEEGLTLLWERDAGMPEDAQETASAPTSQAITEAELVGTWTLIKIGDGNGNADGTADLQTYDTSELNLTSAFAFNADGSAVWTLNTGYDTGRVMEQVCDAYSVSGNELHFYADGTETLLSVLPVVYDAESEMIRFPMMNVGVLIYSKVSDAEQTVTRDVLVGTWKMAGGIMLQEGAKAALRFYEDGTATFWFVKDNLAACEMLDAYTLENHQIRFYQGGKETTFFTMSSSELSFEFLPQADVIRMMNDCDGVNVTMSFERAGENMSSEYTPRKQMDWGEAFSTEGLLLVADLDHDGTEESVGYSLDSEKKELTISVNDQSVTVSDVDMLFSGILIDLDPLSPYDNLLLNVSNRYDESSVVFLHFENGALTIDRTEQFASASLESEKLALSARCWLMGTYFGNRTYHGEDLLPDSEWYETGVLDTVKDMKREEQIEFNWLFEVVSDLPCTIDGKPAVIEPGTWVYLLRWKDTDDFAEIMTEDGRIATLAFTPEYDQYLDGTTYVKAYLIDGVDAETYFDNLCMAG